jgi:hypothetical protein
MKTTAKIAGIYLLLSPFSFSITIYCLLPVLYFLNFDLFKPEEKWNRAFIDKKMIYFILFFIFYVLVISSVSIGILLSEKSDIVLSLVIRFFKQFGSTILFCIQIIFGYFFSNYFSDKKVHDILNIGFLLTLIICFYQYFAVKFGLIYIGNYVVDKNLGIRYSGLCVEPKYLSTYLLLFAFYFLHRLSFFNKDVSLRLKLFELFKIIAALFFFVLSGSANGYIAFIVLLVSYVLFKGTKALISTIFIISLISYFIYPIIDLETIGLREVHLQLLKNISDFNILMLDDMIYMPIMTFEKYPFGFIFGFGPGLMHFYALDFLNYSTWITGKGTYIEGGLSLLMYISNYGIFFFLFFFSFIVCKAINNIRSSSFLKSPLEFYFFYSFVIGALISGNISNPFFISIGWILSRSNLYRYFNETKN